VFASFKLMMSMLTAVAALQQRFVQLQNQASVLVVVVG
jgi:hypothetical protein